MNRRNFVLGGAAIASALVAGPAGAFGALVDPAASYVEGLPGFRTGEVQTPRHCTFYLESGPPSGPLMIFLHGFPELGLIWKAQMAYFAERGWRCVAPRHARLWRIVRTRRSRRLHGAGNLDRHGGAARRARRRTGDLGRPRLGSADRLDHGLAPSRALSWRDRAVRAVPAARACASAAGPVDRSTALSRRSLSGRPMGLLALLSRELRIGPA